MKSILGGISTTTTPKKLGSVSDGYNLRLFFAGGMSKQSALERFADICLLLDSCSEAYSKARGKAFPPEFSGS